MAVGTSGGDAVRVLLDAELLPDVTPAQQRQLHHLLAKLSGGPALTRADDGLRGSSVQ
jgi:hypothetical protein